MCSMGCMCSMGLSRKMRPCRRSLLKEEKELEWQKAMKNEMEQFVEARTRKVFDGCLREILLLGMQ